MAASIFEFPTTGVLTGLELVTQLNSVINALLTNNAGTTAPTNPVVDQLWLNTTTNTLFIYNGTTWVQTTFGAPFTGVSIISAAMSVLPAQFGSILEAQGTATYNIELPDPSDYVGVNVAVFSNLNATTNVTVSTIDGSIIGAGATSTGVSLPYLSMALFISDGYNWIMFSNAGYALLNGSENNTFDVAPATEPTNAVPLSQAQSDFAGINGNSEETFAVADAAAAQDAINLGQAESLFPQLDEDNTYTGDQTFQGTLEVPANSGEVTGGSMPSGFSPAWIQAAFSSSYTGLIQNYYFNGTQVFSLTAAGALTASSLSTPSLSATSGTIGTLSVGTAITVPNASASANPIAYGQMTNGSLNPTFGTLTVTTLTASGNATITGNLTVSGAVNIGSMSLTSMTVGTAAITTLNATTANATTSNTSGTATVGTSAVTNNQTVGGTSTVKGTASSAAGISGNNNLNYGQMMYILQQSLTNNTTAGSQTIASGDLVTGFLSITATQTAAYTLTTDTAANLLTSLPASQVGSSFKLRIINNDQSTTGYAMTLAGGDGVTVSTTLPNPAVAQGKWADYLFTFTAIGSTPTLDVVCVGSN